MLDRVPDIGSIIQGLGTRMFYQLTSVPDACPNDRPHPGFYARCRPSIDRVMWGMERPSAYFSLQNYRLIEPSDDPWDES